MNTEITTLTRTSAISIINNTLENYYTFLECYDLKHQKTMTEDIKDFIAEADETMEIVRTSDEYKTALEELDDEGIKTFFLMCKELAVNNDLSVKLSYPKGDFVIKDICEHEDGAIKVAAYIVGEMQRNVKSNAAKTIRYLIDIYKTANKIKTPFIYIEPLKFGLQIDSYISALGIWAKQVMTNGPWDHKPIIRDMFTDLGIARPLKSGTPSKSYYHKYKNHDYYLDVWSNIHYGYLGAYCGFSEDCLLDGAGIEQLGTYTKEKKIPDVSITDAIKKPRVLDDVGDRECVTLGINLFKQFPNPNSLSSQIVLNKLESIGKGKLGESRLIHYCFDHSKERFTSD